ncbi:MAG: polysaccharide pyruvyl transferase family protein [Luteimonas sp.]
MGAPYQVVSQASRSLVECFQATGQNTGNLLIGNGLFRQLKYENLETYRYAMTPEYVEENFDQVVIAAANFLYPGFDFTPVSSFLDKIKLPVFMVGLGAQLPSSQAELENVPAGTWRLVQIASERSHSIGVRGDFTAEQLRKHGIHNVQVTGCPSLYTQLEPIRIRRPKEVNKIVVNGSRNVVGHASDKEAAAKVEKMLVQLAMSRNLPYVLQNEQPEMQLASGEDPAEHMPTLKSLAAFFNSKPEDLAAYYASYGKLFFSTDEWFSWIRDYDFSFGTRFHGNVAALLNGVPAVIFTHDSRTEELCEFAAIPHVSVSDIEYLDPQEIYECADFDLFEERSRAIFGDYVGFLDANLIAHKFMSQEETIRQDPPQPGAT